MKLTIRFGMLLSFVLFVSVSPALASAAPVFEKMLKRLEMALDLSSEQVAEISGIFENVQVEYHCIGLETNGQRRSCSKEARAYAAGEIRSVLDDKQRERFDRLYGRRTRALHRKQERLSWILGLTEQQKSELLATHQRIFVDGNTCYELESFSEKRDCLAERRFLMRQEVTQIISPEQRRRLEKSLLAEM